MLKADQAESAIPWLEKAAAGHPQAAVNLGAALLHLKRWTAAAAACERALRTWPGLAPLWINLGAALLELKRLEEAAHAFGQGLSAEPGLSKASLGLAMAQHRIAARLLKARRFEAAAVAARAALDAQPDHAPAYIVLGAALRQLDRRAEAAAAYRAAIALRPDSATAHYNLANVLQELGEDAGVEEAYARAIALRPDWPSAHFNHGVWLLKQGRYAEGWPEYDWRWGVEAFSGAARPLSTPVWTGQPIAGRTLLVWAEQGLGDLIQCARYAPLIARRGARVVLEAPPALKTLLASLEGDPVIIDVRAPPPPHDYNCPDLSLPSALGTTLATVPADIPYLRADPARAAAWREVLPEGFTVGVAWQGNPAAPVEPGRSFPLEALAPLAAVPGVRLISLQRDHGLEQLPAASFPVATLGEGFDGGDMADTAAVMAGLDLVVACDTAVAHLAGALGRPVWLGLKYDNDWRWLTGRADSPWYPSARLYRQARRGDWTDVFARMAEDLAKAAMA